MIQMLFRLKMLAKDSVKARDTISRAFETYFSSGQHVDGSGVTRARYDFNHQNGIPLPDIAKFELGGAIAIITNIVPTSFWMVYQLYSDPELLEICRTEVKRVTKASKNPGGGVSHQIDIAGLESSCPTLVAVLKEVLRFRTIGTAVRVVQQDYMLSDQYLLKKGSLVMLPSPVQHSDRSIWGENVGQFDYRRFLGSERHVPGVAFRAFGGGVGLCPGRYFAATVILSFAATLTAQYDVVPLSGSWPHVTTDKAGGWEVSPKPDQEVDVEFIARDSGNDKGDWKLQFTPGHAGTSVIPADL